MQGFIINIFSWRATVFSEVGKTIGTELLCVPANSHACKTKLSCLVEKCELLQLELKHFLKRYKVIPIEETKTPL